MKSQVQFQKRFLTSLLLIGACVVPLCAHALNAPLVRLKTGVSSLTVNAGQQVVDQPLRPMLTIQPSIMWDIPEFSSRLGLSYLQEIGGAYGLTPISGIGIGGYYYLMGISTSYSITEDSTVIQKSRPGLFVTGSLTPVNYNLNTFTENNTSADIHFQAKLYDLSVGVGFDYPITQNMILSSEFLVRNGSGADDKSTSLNYRGYTIFISFATSYY